MRWNRSEIDRLSPLLERISTDLAPVDGKRILVLGSAAGEMAFRLAEMMETGKVTCLEMDPQLLELARRAAHEMGLEGMVEFFPAEKERIPLEDDSFDALVSEFIVYPTSAPSEIGQQEMRRVLAPGGKLIMTDVIVTRPIAQVVRDELEAIGLDYLREARKEDFLSWMADAGMTKVAIDDLSSILRAVWEARRENDPTPNHWKGYETLLDDPSTSLGNAIRYIYIRGEKPNLPETSKIRLV